MAKHLIEIHNCPVIIEHDFTEITKTIYVVAYKSKENSYSLKKFQDITEAFEFESEKPKLVFVELYGTKTDTGDRYVRHHHLKYTGSKLILPPYIEVKYGRTTFRINSNHSGITIQNIDGYGISNDLREGIYYHRRMQKKVNEKTEYYFVDSYYELIPKFENIYLESLFITDVLFNNPKISNKQELEAHLLQSKLKIDLLPKSSKQDEKKKEEIIVDSKENTSLDSLIGLTKVKLEIEELRALAHFRKHRINFGMPVTPSTLHLVFTGNPGTGKTTVARLLAEIYFDIGLLQENKFVEVTRTELVGEYIGHTAQKTQKVFESALGGILFIDEAYSLFKKDNERDFGLEAITTLLKLMEDNRENIVVIVAGYPKEIEDFINSNPGLKSRFARHLNFEDYNASELMQIFRGMVDTYGNTLTNDARHKLEFLIEQNYDSGVFTSNARAVRNIFENTTRKQALRLKEIKNPTQDDLRTFIAEDIPDVFN